MITGVDHRKYHAPADTPKARHFCGLRAGKSVVRQTKSVVLREYGVCRTPHWGVLPFREGCWRATDTHPQLPHSLFRNEGFGVGNRGAGSGRYGVETQTAHTLIETAPSAVLGFRKLTFQPVVPRGSDWVKTR